MTYIWYTRDVHRAYSAMCKAVSENNDTVLDSMSNNMGWGHFESNVNDYIVMDASKYFNGIWDVIMRSCKPTEVMIDEDLMKPMKDKYSRMGLASNGIALRVF